MDKDAKESRNRRIFDMWMACATQEAIAEACDISQPQTVEITKNIGIGELAKSDKAAAEHAVLSVGELSPTALLRSANLQYLEAAGKDGRLWPRSEGDGRGEALSRADATRSGKESRSAGRTGFNDAPALVPNEHRLTTRGP